MRNGFRAALLLLVLLVPAASPAAEQKAPVYQHPERMRWFDEVPDTSSHSILIIAQQFTAPCPGYYQYLSLDRKGRVYTARVVPGWSLGELESTNLVGNRFEQVREKLTHLKLNANAPAFEPQPGKLYTVLLVSDGKHYKRYYFSGALPAPLERVLDLLRVELREHAEAEVKKFLAHERLLKRTYGDWENRKSVIVVGGSGSHGLKGVRGLLLTVTGRRKARAAATEVPIYDALIFYPDGALQAAGSGGRSSDDPLSSQVLVWHIAKTKYRRLEINYQAIDDTISVGGKTYRRGDGNLFVIRLSKNWIPEVVQKRVHLDVSTTARSVLEHFKSAAKNDETIQKLELE